MKMTSKDYHIKLKEINDALIYLNAMKDRFDNIVKDYSLIAGYGNWPLHIEKVLNDYKKTIEDQYKRNQKEP